MDDLIQINSSPVLNLTPTTFWNIVTTPATEFNPMSAQKWMAENWHRSVYLAAAYLLFFRAGQSFMKNRSPYELNFALIIWNVSLTIFSAVGAYYTLPEFVSHLKEYGYFNSYCVVDDYYEKRPLGFWVWLFHLSKAPELVDTIFLIFRKRPVSFLHLYHHTTVLLWCWYCYQFLSSPPRWGVAMNYFVHMIMYAYYSARALRLRLPWIIAPTITSLQLVQFLICVPLNALALYRTYYNENDYFANGSPSKIIKFAQRNYGRVSESGAENGHGCDTTLWLALLQQFLYNTYFLLFAQFFYKTYVKKRKGHSKEE